MTNTSMPLTRQEVFSRVPKSSAITYSTFNRDHRYLTTMDASYLYPVFVDEVYPGDIFELSGRHLNRLLPTVKPFMDNLKTRYFFFYVQNRLLWKNWAKLMGERQRPDEVVEGRYQVPMLNSGSSGVEVGSIFDYAGIPTGVPNLEFSALPFRAMNMIYNYWFRDENLSQWLNVGGSGNTEQDLIDTEFGDSDQLSNYNLFRISKAHDYFTSGLPFQQLGSPQSLSIGTQASVIGDGKALGVTTGGYFGGLIGTYPSGGHTISASTGAYGQAVGTNGYSNNFAANQTAVGVTTDPTKSGLIADLTNVTGFTISDLRTSIQLQALKELNARMGHRLKEIIYGEFDIMVSDATLDIPEFLGSYSKYFNVIPVASTAETSENPQGNLSAFSFTSNDVEHGFVKAFEEHGWVIGFACTTTDQSYQQGLNRMWSRKNKYDYYTPLLADISEQAVKMKEILAQGDNVVDENGDPVDDKTLCYQEAWAELRYKPNMVTGKMRSSAEGSLDVWHLATEFEPTIIEGENLGVPFNQDFIEDNTKENLERVLAVKGEPQIESDNYFHLLCTRELPIYSVPAYLLGRL